MKRVIRIFLKRYGIRVRNARQELELTQIQLAQKVVCSQAIISFIECGFMLPPPHIEQAINAILGIKEKKK